MEIEYNVCCRICLSLDSRLLSLEACGLDETYTHLTGVNPEPSDGMPRTLCVQCAALLSKYQKFREKCHTAYKLLYILSTNRMADMKSSIKSIDRRTHKLMSEYEFSTLTSHVDIPPGQVHIENNTDKTSEVIDVHSSDNENSQDDSNLVIDDIDPIRDNDTQKSKNDIKNNVKGKHIKPSSNPSNLTIHNNGIQEIKVCDVKIKIKDENAANLITDFKTDSDESNEPDSDEDNDLNATSSDDSFHMEEFISFEHKQENCEKIPNKNKLTNKDLKYLKKTLLRPKLQRHRTSKPSSARQRHMEELKKKRTELMDEYFNIKTLVNIEEQRACFEKNMHNVKYTDAKFKCDLCLKGFVIESYFTNHNAKFHDKECGRFLCHLCKKREKQKELLVKHVRDMHMFEYQCKRCEKTFTNEYAAEVHALNHKGITYICDLCGKKSSRSSVHYQHLRVAHPTNDVCAHCGYSFRGELGLRQHVRKAHPDAADAPEGPQCDDCEIQFASEEALAVHRGIKHPELAKTRIRNHTYHQKKMGDSAHTKKIGNETHRRIKKPKIPEKPQPCEECGEVMLSIKQYRGHYMTEHPHKDWNVIGCKLYDTYCVCDQCGKVFMGSLAKYILSDHILEHSTEAPRYECHDCGRKFKTKTKFQSHKQQHKKADCHICGARVGRMNLYKHINTHSEERKWSCTLCDKKFKTKSEANTHRKYVHYKYPWPKKNRNSSDTGSPVKKRSRIATRTAESETENN